MIYQLSAHFFWLKILFSVYPGDLGLHNLRWRRNPTIEDQVSHTRSIRSYRTNICFCNQSCLPPSFSTNTVQVTVKRTNWLYKKKVHRWNNEPQHNKETLKSKCLPIELNTHGQSWFHDECKRTRPRPTTIGKPVERCFQTLLMPSE